MLDSSSPLGTVTVVYRDIYFPNAVFTRSMMLEISAAQGSKDLNLKIDFLGVTRERMHSREKVNEGGKKVRYDIAPYKRLLEDNSGEMWFDPDAFCPGGTLYMKFYVFKQFNGDAYFEGGNSFYLYTPDGKYFRTHVRIREGLDGAVWMLFGGDQPPGAWLDDYEYIGPFGPRPRAGVPMEIGFRCESDGMAIVWNGFETGKKVYKTHPNGQPPQYNRIKSIRKRDTVLPTRFYIDRILPDGYYSMLTPYGADMFTYTNSPTTLNLTEESTVDPMDGFGLYLFRNESGDDYGGQVYEEELSCYDMPRGSVRCVPIGGKALDNTLEGGGPDGLGTSTCPAGYNYLGKVCYNATVYNAIFPDAKKKCGLDEVVYYPTDVLQNHIFRNAMMNKFTAAGHSIWIGVSKDPFTGVFITQAGDTVDERLADWAPGEPSTGDCVVADRTLGYRWRTSSCVEANDYFCTLRTPTCHDGYTWIPETKLSCYKVTVGEGFKEGGNTYSSSASFEEMCMAEGTRLAVPADAAEGKLLQV